MNGEYRTGSGRVIRAAAQLDDGAAGVAVEVEGDPRTILKILKAPSRLDERRLKAMLSIDVPVRVPGAAAVIAWPTDIVFDGQGRYVGFLMPRAPQPRPVNLSTLALRREREKELGENIGWDALLTIAANYSAAVAALHANSVVLCDINLKNAVVSGDLTVTVIDCDSTQIRVGGETFLSSFCQEEFLAPELKGRNLGTTRREQTSDCWSLAVLIWMTLMDAHHPFTGVWKGPGELERDDHVIAGRFPYAADAAPLEPSPQVPPWRALPRELQDMFMETFKAGAREPDRRPAALEWAEALRRSKATLKQCNGASGRLHFFPAAERSCPWCEYETFLRPPASRSASSPRPTAAPKTPPPVAAPVPAPSPPGRSNRVPSRAWAILAVLVAVAIGVGLTEIPDSGSDSGSATSKGGGAAVPAPARVIARHYRRLDAGAYNAAFGLMSPGYRRGHRGWLRQARAARPRISVIHVGRPKRRGRVASVPVLFFARDTRDTRRSDTRCRRFDGRVRMVGTPRGWRYDPEETFQVTEMLGGHPRCP
jgi:protein kinase-like protein